MKARCEYRYHRAFGTANHMWIAIGPRGAVHLHIADHSDTPGWPDQSNPVSGGIECHWRSTPDYMKDEPPSFDECAILKCPCWHDGSSMQATDYWIPLWQSDPNNHDRMFEQLTGELINRFKEPE